ncbi:enterochelin esterase-like enzyme [Pedobacter sp. UYP30]|uniref:alpha/beta hydrolase n=1 Tax=Pedobacter sp. UYP30 TaxID=1756400 RepID=UPI003391D8F4
MAENYKIIEEKIISGFLKREVAVTFYVPTVIYGNDLIDLLLLNDGQDVAKMNFVQILSDAQQKQTRAKLVVVAIEASLERVAEYGVVGRPDFKQRGKKAGLYSKFILEELFPFILKKLAQPIQGRIGFAGFSLGGLSAFDIAWNNGDIFDVVGVFSGSFWWRKKDLKAGYTDADRILHAMIDESSTKPDLKFWLMTGTEDETSDRNGNNIIDSIDDTVDVIKSLLRKDYKRPNDIRYYEKVGGKHNPETWAAVMPAFLAWAFGD